MESGAAFGEAQYTAIQRAIGQCMADRGYDYEYRPYEYIPPRQYGVTDPDVAAVWGFRRESSFGGERDAPNAHPPQDPSQSPEEKAWSEALLGSGEEDVAVTDESGRVVTRYGPDGCSAQGRLSVNPDYFEERVLHQVLLDIHGRAIREVQQSTQFQDAFDQWRQCYSDAGFGPVETVDEYFIGGLAPEYRSSETITQNEIDAAVAAATCVHESGFLRTWSGMLALAEQRLLEENPGVLTEYLEIQQNVREDLGV